MTTLALSPQTAVQSPMPAAQSTQSALSDSAALLPAGYDVGATSTTQRIGVVVAMLGLHLALVWALLQWAPARQALAELSPIMVDMIAPAPQTPQPRPKPEPPREQAKVKQPPRQPPVVAAQTPVAPSVAAVTVPEQQPAPVAVTKPVDAPPTVVPEVPREAPKPAAPKTLSISAVSYLVPPELVYPQAARRAQEEGRAMVRVLVDSQGRPSQLSVAKSSGYPRLDEAALSAARVTRFKPYMENGVALAFWVQMPFVFELEN